VDSWPGPHLVEGVSGVRTGPAPLFLASRGVAAFPYPAGWERAPFFHRVTALFCQAGARPASFSSLREAVLCPTGFERSLGLGVEPSPPARLRMRPSRTSRGGAPRCSQKATPAIPHRGMPLGTHTLRRNGSCRPRGGFHPNRPLEWNAREVLAPKSSVPASMSLAEGWGFRIAKRVPAAMPPSTAGTQRADRDGVSVTRSVADTEGPRHGARCWVAVEGVSERSERRRASNEGPSTRLAR